MADFENTVISPDKKTAAPAKPVQRLSIIESIYPRQFHNNLIA